MNFEGMMMNSLRASLLLFLLTIVGVLCEKESAVRLVSRWKNKETSPDGRLEIYHSGEWGTVCDDGFTQTSAEVVCANLGYGNVGKVIGNHHGGGSGRIWLDEVKCIGNETSIDDCPHLPWGENNCHHGEDVSVSCSNITELLEVRLVNGNSSSTTTMEGRLEVYFSGEWGTVCDDGFTNINAMVVCAYLGFRDVGRAIGNRHGNGSGRIWLDEVKCIGNEKSIADCPHQAWGESDCTHGEDVSVSCSNITEHEIPRIRLVNWWSETSNPVEGRLEIYHMEEWGTVCDDGFTNISAMVVCASLGFGNVGKVIANSLGSGSGRIWLDEVKCSGKETSIGSCTHLDWGVHNCDHSEDVAISCSNTTQEHEVPRIRLVNWRGSMANPNEGRLEIYHSGEWGTVCDDGFTNISAMVVCASLGFGDIGRIIGNRYGGGSGPIWLDEVKCSGNETNIGECSHLPWGENNCQHGEDVSVSCRNTSETEVLSIPSVRLVNRITATPLEGRLEILYSGEWGTVCDDGFTNTSAMVVCASLGFGNVGRVVVNIYGSAFGPIWLDEVKCSGTETNIADCSHLPWSEHNCGHSEDVAISCSNRTETPGPGSQEVPVRLVSESSFVTNATEGRLEIFYAGEWGTVCDDGFTDTSARIICASLGFGNVGRVIGNTHGEGTGQIWLDDVSCIGTEQSIDKCPHGHWGAHNCGHSEDVSISCNPSAAVVRVRLVNPESSTPAATEGRLEVFYSGEWGTVCDDGFTELSAKVVCASLGLGNGGAVIGNRYGSGTGRIWLDEVKCSGNEADIADCSHLPWGENNCQHTEDVSLQCYVSHYNESEEASLVRLVNSFSSTTNTIEGRVEIFHAGEWGTVCDDGFTNISAMVVCASLGFGYVGEFIGNRHGGGTGRIWLDEVDCRGTEENIDRCLHQSWGVHNCGHSEDVSVSCSNTSESLEIPLRLVNLWNLTTTLEGRLEIYRYGSWGTVCDDGFTNMSASVACASMGFGYVGTFIGNRYGGGTGPIWLDELKCNGTEDNIEICRHRPWGDHDCDHSEDVSISCERSPNEASTSTSSSLSEHSSRNSNVIVGVTITIVILSIIGVAFYLIIRRKKATWKSEGCETYQHTPEVVEYEHGNDTQFLIPRDICTADASQERVKYKREFNGSFETAGTEAAINAGGFA